jgi:hypothetical protein
MASDFASALWNEDDSESMGIRKRGLKTRANPAFQPQMPMEL